MKEPLTDKPFSLLSRISEEAAFPEDKHIKSDMFNGYRSSGSRV
jgi:hypothetical protein